MVFRYFLGNMLREMAEEHLRSATDNAQGETQQGQTEGQEHAPPQPPPTCDVAVVFALGIEAGGLIDLLKEATLIRGAGFSEHLGKLRNRTVSIAAAGVGRQKAAAATADLIEVRKPQWVVSAGFAGGLQDGLAKGHFLMADGVTDTAGKQLSVGLKMDKDALAASPGVHVGQLLTVDQIIRSPQEKRQLGEQHDALACDMETIGVAEVCQQKRVRFLSVRIISDTVEDQLPVELEKLLAQQSTAAKLGAAAGAIWNRPGSVKDMWKLKEDALAASDRLAKFTRDVIGQLDISNPPALTTDVESSQ